MAFHFCTPSPALAPFVQLFWLQEAEYHDHAMERVLPDGCMELIINLTEDEIRDYDPQEPSQFETHPGAIVCGPRSEFMVIDTDNQTSVMGVHFRPGGAYLLVGCPTRELKNQTVALEYLWGRTATELRHQLLAASNHEEKFRLLDQALQRRLENHTSRHPAVAWTVREIERAPASRPLADITAQLGFSSRHFIEIFSREVGLTPKRFYRVRRFQQAVERIHSLNDPRWADLAVSCGYYDQAHFIHDFRGFCGLTPRAYFAHRNLRHANHVPLET